MAAKSFSADPGPVPASASASVPTPVASVTAPAAVASVTRAAPMAAPHRALVLVVDDSSDMRGLIDDVLTAGGYEVITAASGGRALTLMAERRPDLVVTDLMMPGMSGFTLRAEMLRRTELARVPVVVLSAYWQRPSETLDVVEVLSKPINVDRLLAVVAAATQRQA